MCFACFTDNFQKEATNGNIVWNTTIYNRPWDVERLNCPPYIPSNPNPEDGVVNVDINADLSWSGGDPDFNDIVLYDVYFGTNPNPPLKAEDLTDTFYNPGTMDFDTLYFWKIVATDNHDASTEGPVWSYTTLENGPPGVPRINGPSSGKMGETLSYTFVSEDPNGDGVFYEIDWGDGQVDPWDGPHDSNSVITKTHEWQRQGTFTINARAKDVYDAIGEWGEFEVTIPRNRASTYHWYHWFLERFPLLEKLRDLLR